MQTGPQQRKQQRQRKHLPIALGNNQESLLHKDSEWTPGLVVASTSVQHQCKAYRCTTVSDGRDMQRAQCASVRLTDLTRFSCCGQDKRENE